MSINVNDEALISLRERENATFVTFVKGLKADDNSADVGMYNSSY